MRFYLIWLFFLFMSIYARRQWFYASCFLLLSMAILERPDMPRSMLGITGFSPWNVLFFFIFISMLADASRKTIVFPPKIKFFIAWFMAVITIALLRELGNLDATNYNNQLMDRNSRLIDAKEIIVDHFINSFKFCIPGLFFFYGVKDQKSFKYAVIALAGVSFLLALQVVKSMPLGALIDGNVLEKMAIRKIDRDIGYYRSDLAILFAGGIWVIYLSRAVFSSVWANWFGLGAAFLTLLAMGLTGGRIGMGAWLVLSMVFAWFRMRKMIVLGPIVIAVVIALVPAVQERFLQGISTDDDPYASTDFTSATSGRADVWPYVIDKIGEAPIIGFGRGAMISTGLTLFLSESIDKTFVHPHNAYLTLFLDNGFLFGLPVLFFFIVLLTYSFRLFKDKRNKIYPLAGGVSFAFLFAHMVGSLGSQTFYPVGSSVPMWCAAGMMLRIYLERQKLGKKDLKAHQAFYSS